MTGMRLGYSNKWCKVSTFDKCTFEMSMVCRCREIDQFRGGQERGDGVLNRRVFTTAVPVHAGDWTGVE